MNQNIIMEEDAKTIVSRVNLSELAGKEILITGATGLLGTYFLYTIKACRESGIPVKKVHIICRSQVPGYLQDLIDQSWIQLWQGDLCDDSFRKNLPECAYIIHAAGYGQPAKFVINEDKTLKLNTTVTFDLLDKLKQNGKFLFISSSGIYNGLEKECFDESDVGTTSTLHPRACYIEGKRCGEAICNSYRKKGIHVKAARLSYTYGPGVRLGDQRALYAFIEKGLHGDIALLDHGDAERIYCYVADAVEILWNILLFGREPIYNVGAKEKVTILELAEKIAKTLEVSVLVPNINKTVAGCMLVERLNIAKIEQEFGKTDFVPLDKGLQNTIKWMQIQYSSELKRGNRY